MLLTKKTKNKKENFKYNKDKKRNITKKKKKNY